MVRLWRVRLAAVPMCPPCHQGSYADGTRWGEHVAISRPLCRAQGVITKLDGMWDFPVARFGPPGHDRLRAGVVGANRAHRFPQDAPAYHSPCPRVTLQERTYVGVAALRSLIRREVSFTECIILTKIVVPKPLTGIE